LWIADGERAAPGSRVSLPAVPEGCFLHWLFVQELAQLAPASAKARQRSPGQSAGMPSARLGELPDEPLPPLPDPA